jgi:TolB-like protein/class 3 adenylate cyclase/tetratricopeptide (TPR) repeat protein
MATKEIERKIAVIFATDVVGYSKSVEKNEDQTIKNFRVCKKILEDLFKEHDGRIFNTAGDSVLAEFSSAVSAVICATEFQRLIKERNESETTDLKMEFRIGINMGDVVIEGENLYGDGVNIAARLEALAQPNGVCLSRSVHEFINKKMDFLFNDLGEQTVKDNKFHAFDVVIDDSHKRTVKTKSKSQVPLIAAIVGILVLGIGGFAYYNFSIKETDQKNGKAVETSSDRPAILVKPFANQSGKKENDYIGNGMTSHLITTLSQHEQLLVLGKSTGEYLQKNQVSDEDIVKKYGVQFVLGGGIQVSGNKTRINVELKDLAKNEIIWSEIYDFSEDDIFNIQDQVGSSVLSHLQIEITMGGIESTALKRLYTPEVYKNILLGTTAFQLMTPEGHYEAERLWEINKKLEPDNFYLDTNRSWQLVQKTWFGISKNPQEDLKKAHRLALGVLEKDPEYVGAMSIAAMIEQTLGDFNAACGRIDKMSILSVEVVDIAMVADTQRSCGDYDRSIETYEKVHRIAPHYSAWVKVYYLFAIMMKTFEEKSENYEKAKNYALEHSNKDYIMAGASETFHTVLAYIYHKEGDIKLAKDHFEKQKTMKNSITKWWIENYDFVNSRPKEFMNDYVKVLQSLGMPDQ